MPDMPRHAALLKNNGAVLYPKGNYYSPEQCPNRITGTPSLNNDLKSQIGFLSSDFAKKYNLPMKFKPNHMCVIYGDNNDEVHVRADKIPPAMVIAFAHAAQTGMKVELSSRNGVPFNLKEAKNNEQEQGVLPETHAR